jgi:DNA-binding transcriptional MerR regulator
MRNALPKPGIKIQELAARTGVSKSTIHYYAEKGLLPPPKKTSRTMAYYDESCVERIRLIRDFQEKAFFPLDRIKRLLETVHDDGMLENILVISAQYVGSLTGAEPSRAMSEHEVESQFGIARDRLERLERLRVLSPELRDGRRLYHREDVEILRVLRRMSERGFSQERGWPAEGLSIYVEAARQLAEKEVGLLFERMSEGLHPKDTQALFNSAGEDIFLSLFLWLRRREMRREFARRVKQMKDTKNLG